MKKVFAIVAMAAVSVGCSGWTINGIGREDLQGGDFISVAAGAATSYLTHASAHAVMATAVGEDWHYEGFSEIVDGELSKSEGQWFARAGFVAQLLVGWIMKICGAEGPFAKGYYFGTAFEIATYPAMNELAGNKGDDVQMIDDNGGNGHLEWGVYAVAALGLIVEKK